MRATWILAALAVALAAQTTLGGLVARRVPTPDLVLAVVVGIGLRSGPLAGLASGTVAGLVQDALTSGILGMGGIARTVVGYLAGVAGSQFVVAAPVPRFVVFVAASLLYGVVFMGGYVVLGLREFSLGWTGMLAQAAGTGLVGVLGTQLVEAWPHMMDRWRARRSARVRR